MAIFSVSDNVAGKGNDPFNEAVNTKLSGKLISMPSPSLTLVNHSLSSSLIKCDEAPLALLAIITCCLGRLVIL